VRAPLPLPTLGAGARGERGRRVQLLPAAAREQLLRPRSGLPQLRTL